MTKRGTMVYPITKNTLWPIIKLFIKEIKGIENLPNKPYIIASNHQSYIDPAIMILLIAEQKNEKIYSLALKEKFNNWFWNMIFEHFGAIRVNGSVEKAIQKIKQGNSVIIYPEGRRTQNGKLQKVKHTGAAVLALETKKPVIPVYIKTYNWWNRNQTTPNFKKNITVNIGKPIIFKQKTNKQNIQKTLKKIMNEVKKLAPHN